MKSKDWKVTTVARRKKKISANAHLYNIEESYTMPDGRIVEKDEIIKIAGEHGVRFRFKSHVTRTDTGIEWIDCFELEKGITSKHRSFRPERIKVIPKRRTRRPK